MIKSVINLNASPETWEVPKIDPKSISDADYFRGCRILHKYIQKCLADPVERAKYEAWKAEHEKQKAERGELNG